MAVYQLIGKEAQFADIIWSNEPIASPRLAELAEEQLGWKKPTSYNVLRRLCEKGIFKNEKAVVTSLIGRDDFFTGKSEMFVKENYNCSLPAFLVSFMGNKRLTSAEAKELHKLVDEYTEEE